MVWTRVLDGDFGGRGRTGIGDGVIIVIGGGGVVVGIGDVVGGVGMVKVVALGSNQNLSAPDPTHPSPVCCWNVLFVLTDVVVVVGVCGQYWIL